MNIIERVKNKPGYKFLAVIGLIYGLWYIGTMDERQYINEIKNNDNVSVMCNIKGKGFIDIDKSKITGILDDGHNFGFMFSNGYSTNCEVYGLNK